MSRCFPRRVLCRRGVETLRPELLLGDDQQCQPEAVEDCKGFVQAHAALSVFQARHEIDRYAEEGRGVIDAQLLSAAALADHRSQGAGGFQLDGRRLHGIDIRNVRK